MKDPHFAIRIDQTRKIHRTVQRLRGQQEELMKIQDIYSESGTHPSQEMRLNAFDAVLREINRELSRLLVNQAAASASEKLGV